MNVLKFKVNNKNILKFLTVNVEQLCFTRLMKTQNAVKPKPVLMSYASYESTQSSSERIPPLIVMHGLFGSKGNWNSLCKAMQSKSNPSRKIIAVDSRNHGDSPHAMSHTYEDIAEDIKHLMDTQDVPKAVLLGHSMGGKAAMYFALKYPELVERLIVVDISPYSTSSSMGNMYTFFGLMQNMRLDSNLPLSSARMEADAMLSRIINDKGVRAFILTNLIKKEDGSYNWRMNVPALISNFQKIAGFPNLGTGVYESPTLLLTGGLSDCVQKTDLAAIKHLFPKIQFAVIEGAGHWIHSEKPNEFMNFDWRINIPTLSANFPNIASFPILDSWVYTGPTLFISGGLSDFVQQSDRRTVKRLFPKVEFTVIPDAGHWLHSEKPNEFMKYVIDFINYS